MFHISIWRGLSPPKPLGATGLDGSQGTFSKSKVYVAEHRVMYDAIAKSCLTKTALLEI